MYVLPPSALVETAGMDALEPLLLLLNDEDPWVQCAALKSLVKLKKKNSRWQTQ
jgi:HEAT repeat protein